MLVDPRKPSRRAVLQRVRDRAACWRQATFALPQTIVAALLFVVVLLSSQLAAVSALVSLDDMTTVLALVAVAFGMMGAISISVIGQLHDEPRGLWLSVGLTLYSLVAIPAATLNAHEGFGEAPLGNVRLTAHILFAVSILGAVFVAERPPRDGWICVIVAGLLLGLAGAVGIYWPDASLAVNTAQPVRYGVCILWVLASVGVVVQARVHRVSWLLWTGLGCAAMGVAHIIRVSAGSPAEPLGVAFSLLRLLGVVLVFLGVVPAARRVLVESFLWGVTQNVQLAQARDKIRAVARRDHEIRNIVNLLTSAATFLGAEPRGVGDPTLLHSAMIGEMRRLNELLRPHGGDPAPRDARNYEVVRVIQHQVALAATSGMDARVIDADSEFWAWGDPNVLAQVLANVLGNCERHAPGSPVRISLSRRGLSVVIRVRDFGPGVPAGLERKVFESGVRRTGSDGQGFGLHITRELLDGQSGRVRLASRSGEGCTVVIEVPVAGWEVEAS
jgi:two-component system OmpR family sensor kinase